MAETLPQTTTTAPDLARPEALLHGPPARAAGWRSKKSFELEDKPSTHAKAHQVRSGTADDRRRQDKKVLRAGFWVGRERMVG
jgi:hypothetical protein